MELFQHRIVDAHNELFPEEGTIDWDRLVRDGYTMRGRRLQIS